jgi:hypothetical protein
LAGAALEQLALLANQLARLQHPASASILPALAAAAAGRPVQPQQAHHTAGLMLALARLGYSPPAQQLEQLLQHLLSARRQLQPQALVDASMALAAWQVPRQQAGWCACLCAISQPALGHFTARQACQLLWALGQAGHRPASAWLDDFCAATLPQMARLSAQDLATCVRALAILRFSPPLPWLAALVHESGGRLPSLPPPQLANLCWGFAQLRVPVSALWFERAMQSLERCRGRATPPQLAITLSALSALKPAGASEELVEYVVLGSLEALGPALGQLSSSLLHHLAFCISAFGASPDEAWMAALVGASRAQLQAFSTGHLAVLLASLHRVRYRPGDAFLEEALEALRARRRQLQPGQAAAVHRALLYMDRKRAASFAGQAQLLLLLGRGKAGSGAAAVIRRGGGGAAAAAQGRRGSSRRASAAALLAHSAPGGRPGAKRQQQGEQQEEQGAAGGGGNGTFMPAAVPAVALAVAAGQGDGGYSYGYSARPAARLALSSTLS